MQGTASREWLVKTAVEICGPFTYEEVSEAIKNKEFILVDEVAKSFGRWKYIRDESAFEKVILELQNKSDLSGEKTFTQTETDALTEELSSQIVNFSHAEKLLSNVSSQTDPRKEEKVSNPEVSKKTYGVKTSTKKSFINKNRLFKMGTTALIVISFSFFFFYKGKQQEVSFDEYKKKSIDAINAGDLVGAKESVTHALKIKEDNELIFMLATLDLTLGDVVASTKGFEALKYRTNNPQTLSQIYNYLGVINLKNYNLSRARLEFEAALEQDPQFVPSLYNKGVVDYLENKFDAAFANFTQAMVHGGLDGTILLSVADVMTKRSATAVKESQNTDGYYINLIQKHIQSFQVFKQELLVASAYLNALTDLKSEVESNVSKALDVDPDLTSQHVMNQSLYRGLISWDIISEWAEKLQSQYPQSENIKTLVGYSYFKGTEKMKGKEYIESMLKPDFSNVANQNIYGFILYSLGQNEAAKVALSHTQKNSLYSLSKLLLGKICIKEKNLDCAQEYFEKVLAQDGDNLGASVGLGEVFLIKENKVKAQEYTQKAFRLSNYSKDVQALKQKVEMMP